MALRVLDTDHLSLFQRGHPAILPRIQELPATRIAIGIVSVEEMLQGRLAQVRRASTGKERVRAYAWLEKTMAFFRGFRVLPFDTREIPTSFFLVKRVRLFRLLNTVVCPWFPWSVPGFPSDRARRPVCLDRPACANRYPWSVPCFPLVSPGLTPAQAPRSQIANAFLTPRRQARQGLILHCADDR